MQYPFSLYGLRGRPRRGEKELVGAARRSAVSDIDALRVAQA
jgi:hypothetical protein